MTNVQLQALNVNGIDPAQIVGEQHGAGHAQIDIREQLFNDGATGPISHVQLPAEAITSLRGILFDLDLSLMCASPLLPQVPENPREFYTGSVQPWLSRHPTLAKSKVLLSGTGLHSILCFEHPVEFGTDAERDRWAGIVEVVQASLPVDPDQPGITATTSPVGSINGKNGQTVELLAPGQFVTSDEVMELYEQMMQAPFRTVFSILAGAGELQPCPICGQASKRLVSLDRVGQCYGGCGQVDLDALYEVFLAPRTARGAQ